MAVRHWLDSNGNWTTAADWTGDVVPGPTDEVVLDAAGSYTVSEDASSTAPIDVHSIEISTAGAVLQITDVVNNKVGAGGVSNAGSFGLAGTAALTVTGGFVSNGTLDLDTGYGDGGGSLTIGGTLDNTGTVQVGSGYDNLSAATTLTLGGLKNPTGASFALYGSASHAATLVFKSGGAGFTDNGGSFGLTNTAPLTLSNSLTNSGSFGLAGTAALTVTGGFVSNGTLDLDAGSGDGGGSLTIGGTLDNTGTVQVGSGYDNLSAATTLTLGGLKNPTGASFALYGSASHAATLVFKSGGAGFTDNGGSFGLTNTAPLTLSNSLTNSGSFGLAGTAALTVTGGFVSNGTLDLDTGYGDGGGSLTIGGTLDNTGTVQVGSGYDNLSAATTLTLGGLKNPTGASFALYGSASHAATLVFKSGGAGFTDNGGSFGLTNTAPLTLSNSLTNSGSFGLAGTAALTVTGGFVSNGTLDLDAGSGDGGGSLTIGGTLDNTGTVQVGSGYDNLSAATTLTLGGLKNPTGASFALYGSASHAATLVFKSGGAGFTDNGGSFGLTNTAPLTLSNSLTNSGSFGLAGTAALTVTGGFVSNGTLDLDAGSGDGGGSLTIGGTLDNTGTVQVGSGYDNLSAATTLTLGGLKNPTGASFALYGSASHAATLTVTGPAANSGSLDIGSYSVLDVTDGNAFTQTAGTTTVYGTLTAATIAIDGGTLAVDTTNFTDTGTIIAADGGKIDFSAGGLTNLSGTTLTGGAYVVEAGSTLQLPNNVTVGTLAADLTVSGAGWVMQSFDTSTSTEVGIEITLKTIAAGGALSVVGGGSYTTTDKITDSGLLTVGGGSTFTAGSLSVAAGGTLVVDGGATLSLGSPLTIAGTVADAGRLILDPGFKIGGKVVGDGDGSVLELAKGSGSSGILNALGTNFTDFGTVTIDAGATWTVDALALALSGVTITGSGGSNNLTLKSAGTVNLAGVSGFPTIDLATGDSTVAVTKQTLSGGKVTITDGLGGGNNIINVAGSAGETLIYMTGSGSDTFTGGAENDVIRGSSSGAGQTLTFIASSGTDTFTGGAENDIVKVSAKGVGGDTLTGGSGTNTLDLGPASASTFSLAGVNNFGKINLAAGNNTVTVTDNTLSGGSVTLRDGASGNNIINVTGSADETLIYMTGSGSDTFTGGAENDVIHGSSHAGQTLTFNAGAGIDTLTGGAENDVVTVSAAAVSGDTLTGGSGTNTLTLTTAGTLSLSGVSNFGTINLAAGDSTVTVTDTTLSGGPVTINDGASGNNSISAAGSAGESLTYVTGSGSGTFTGGTENDVVKVSAAAVGGDTLTGGSGTNTLTLTTAGTISLSGVSGFETYRLFNGPGNNLTLADANFIGVTDGTITVDGGNAGNRLSEKGVSAADEAVLRGGAGADTLIAGLHAVMKGGAGADVFELTTPGTTATPDRNTITDFTSGTDEIAFSNAGFSLGLPSASGTPQPLPVDLFSSKTNGTFDNATERFAYNAGNGHLIYDAQGNTAGSSPELVATLTGHPTLLGTDLFFVS